MSNLNDMPDNTRLWIFQADRNLSNDEQDRVLSQLREFLTSWNAHGQKLTAATDIKYQRFLIIAVDESQAMASGCSIDDMFRKLRDIGSDISLDFFDRTQLAYRVNGESEIHTVALSQFADKVTEIGKENIRVFNNLIDKLGELDNHWETSIDESWHAKLL